MASRAPNKKVEKCHRELQEAVEKTEKAHDASLKIIKIIIQYREALNDPTISLENRGILMGSVEEFEDWLERHDKSMARYDRRLFKAEKALYKAVLSSAEFRQQFTNSTTQDCFRCKTLTGTMSGFAGSGKSHTLALMTGETPPSIRVSTPVSQVPTRTITNTTIGVDKQNTFTAISDENYTDKFVVTARDGITTPSQTASRPGFLLRVFSKPTTPTQEVEEDLMVKLATLGDEVESFEGQTVVEISDCGGQPQFLEILPRFLENLDFGIIVTDLSQSFDDYPLNFYFSEEGMAVGVGVPSQLNNEQVFRMCLQMIASQSQGERPVMFAVVGTHRDLEGSCTHAGKEEEADHKEGKCCESRLEKNRRIKAMVASFGLQNNVLFRSRHEYIFAINAKKPEPIDYETIGELKERIMAECKPRMVSIPISYHAVELILKKKAEELGHIAFVESDILMEVPNCNFTEDSFKDALRYLHWKKRVFYFEKDFPGRVIGQPQAVLNKQTEIAVYHIELSTKPEEEQLKLAMRLQRFVRYGILTLDLLERFPDHYVEGVFTPADMMKLFVRLLIVSELSGGEYLMPCVLKADVQPDYNPEPDTQSLPPMLLHFQGGPVRFGVFCGTICYVMTTSKWKVLMDTKADDQPFHITRNSVHFSLPECRGKVTISDPLDSFLIVTIHIPTDVPSYSECVSCAAVDVRDTLLSAITEVTKKLNYSPDTPEVAFLCAGKHDTPTSLHPAKVSRLSGELLCTKVDNTTGGSLSPTHKVWLRKSSTEAFAHLPSHSDCPDAPALSEIPSIEDKPHLYDLELLKTGDEQLRIIRTVAVKWEELALHLQLPEGIIDIIRRDYRNSSCEDACREVFRRWLEGDVKWKQLTKALKNMEYGVMADKVLKLLHPS